MKPIKPCCQSKPPKLDLFDPAELEDKSVPACCQPKPITPDSSEEPSGSCCSKKGFDWLLWLSLSLVLLAYPAHWLFHEHFSDLPVLSKFTHGIYEMMNKMWLGLAIGILAVGLLGNVSKTFIRSLLGPGGTMKGILRATLAGLVLDLCNHGILLVAMQLYKKGASLGQTFAFLIASPWNSLSMTIILWALIGWQWTIAFILGSAVIAIIAGYLTDKIIKPKVDLTIPNCKNPSILQQIKSGIRSTKFDSNFFKKAAKTGWTDSRSIIKWILFGAVLAAAVRAFIPTESFATYFGPSLLGISLTLLVATIIEVCSEGSSPLAADMVNTAQAPGNGFTFLMAGAATDYTEMMALKVTTKSWKRAFLLPALTLPQVIAIALVMNMCS